MTKQEILEKAKEVFDFNKDTDELLAAEDGNFFLPTGVNVAREYASRKGLKLITIKRKEVEELKKNEDGDKPISKMNKTELLELAGSLGLEADEENTKKEIIELIEASKETTLSPVEEIQEAAEATTESEGEE